MNEMQSEPTQGPPGPAAAHGALGARRDGRPADAETIRREIDLTRARMSRTLDEIEDRIVRRKEELWARATLRDFRQRITSEPWRSVVVAFAIGYVIAAIRD